MSRVRTGLDRIAAHDDAVLKFVKGRRVALLAHAASVDSRWRPAQQILQEAGADLRVLFGPEHGFAGAAQDMVGVASQRGELPTHSLYGESYEDLSPKAAWLDGLDAVVIDLQDVGSRYYTYVWTAALMLRAAAAQGVETIVLDRPNPLGGVQVEGASQREGYRSFVGLYCVSVRHGLTIAELLRFVCDQEGLGKDALWVVPMQGWRRDMAFEDTGLPWVIPSPNMPTLDTARVYPGGCLIEGTTLSEGRGTTRPFELWGAPGIDARAVVSSVHIEGAVLRPVTFLPMFQKHAGQLCNGLQVHVTDESAFMPWEAYLRLLAAALPQLPPEERWRTEEYEFVSDRPAIDLLTGDPEFREAVDSGASLDDYLAADRAGAHAFAELRRDLFLYESDAK